VSHSLLQDAGVNVRLAIFRPPMYSAKVQ